MEMAFRTMEMRRATSGKQSLRGKGKRSDLSLDFLQLQSRLILCFQFAVSDGVPVQEGLVVLWKLSLPQG